MRREVCRCEAWDFPHRLYSGECMGHNLSDCPSQIRWRDPYGTGDWWYAHVEHGCAGYNGASGYAKTVYKNA